MMGIQMMRVVGFRREIPARGRTGSIVWECG
jgi:hypothetical protein